MVTADGDATVRTSVVDIVRSRNWPPEFTIRVLRNALVSRWHGRENALKAELATAEECYAAAVHAGDAAEMAVIVGEAIGLVDAVRPAAVIIAAMVADAEIRLRGGSNLVVGG